MYVLLFNLTNAAMIGWALMIFLPRAQITTWIARTAVFPVYLAALYVIGVVPLLVASGPGIMREFASADGVVRLLAGADAALIVWLHLLVFDHLVGILIYRDNMRIHAMSLPVQSLVLFLTLMFGPAGFLVYYVIRVVRKHGPAIGEARVH